MPVRHRKTIRRLLICGLLPVFNVQAEDIRVTDIPSMDFLEYLGGIEHEIDGELSSPVELDLEAALVASNYGSKNIDSVSTGNEADEDVGSEVSNEVRSGARSEERIDE